ncbi:MAG: YcxB family protein [Methylobacteriaceae bacterium]|nr:YcxB family protein [Methylobacteriaceae bacterium]
MTFRYQTQDFLSAYRLNAKLLRRHVIYLTFFLAAVVAVLFWFEPAWDARAVACGAGAAGGLAAFVLVRYIYLPLHAKRQFANYPIAHREQVLTLEAEGLRHRSGSNESLTPWRDFVAWQADEQVVLLYIAPRIFQVVPARLAELGFPIKELKGALARDFAMR